MATRVGVVQFPGSNCELDAMEAVRLLGGEAEICWHGDADLGGVDAVVIPGGFAHGDYLRPGAIARFSPVMSGVVDFAAAGGPVVGICNGFQVLTNGVELGSVLRVPINHFEGNYTCSTETLTELRSDDRVVLRYVDNPNGSVDDIAAITNEGRNVVGVMPHPERAISALLGSEDGRPLLRSVLGAAAAAPV
jgi:phosphoribosylformylglycinamidine synthase